MNGSQAEEEAATGCFQSSPVVRAVTEPRPREPVIERASFAAHYSLQAGLGLLPAESLGDDSVQRSKAPATAVRWCPQSWTSRSTCQLGLDRWDEPPSFYGTQPAGAKQDLLNAHRKQSHAAPFEYVVPALLHVSCAAPAPDGHPFGSALDDDRQPPALKCLLPPFPAIVPGHIDPFASLRGHLDGPGQPNFDILKYTRSFSAPASLDTGLVHVPIYRISASQPAASTTCEHQYTTPAATSASAVAEPFASGLPDRIDDPEYAQPFRRAVSEPDLADQAEAEAVALLQPTETKRSIRLLAQALLKQEEDQRAANEKAPAHHLRPLKESLKPMWRTAELTRRKRGPEHSSVPPKASGAQADLDAEKREDTAAEPEEDAEGESDDEYIDPQPVSTRRRQVHPTRRLRKTASDGDFGITPSTGAGLHLIKAKWSEPALRPWAYISATANCSPEDEGRDLLALPIQEPEYTTPSMPVGKGRKAKSNGIALWRGSVMKAKVLGQHYLAEDGETVLYTNPDKKLPFDIRFIAASLDKRFDALVHWKEVVISGATVEVIVIPDTKKFAKTVVPAMDMTASDFTSVERQFNLYGFSRSLVVRPDGSKVMMLVNEQMTLTREEKDTVRARDWLRDLRSVQAVVPQSRASLRSVQNTSGSRELRASIRSEQATPSTATTASIWSPSSPLLPITPADSATRLACMPLSAVRDEDFDDAAWNDTNEVVVPKRKRLPKKAEVAPEVGAGAEKRIPALTRKRSRL